MEVYQHFRKEEQPFIDQVLSWKEQVERSFIPKLTDFLDPREQEIVIMLIGEHNEELQVKDFGGGNNSERRRMLLAPKYEDLSEDMFQVELLEANFQPKFVTIEHPDVMGAFLSQGMKRKKLGDIIIADGKIQIMAASEISTFVQMNLTSIRKSSVYFEQRDLQLLIKKHESWIEQERTVSSLRLDTVVKEIYPISRKEATTFIQKGLVKVNYKVVDDNKFQLQEKDMISIRGHGRSKLTSIRGKSKKDKVKITIATLK
ncbi:RNA-binding protein [Oceanobacillus sp. 1P07AA]|uniref:YlmH family RNA-binding protein n=1 Tax=Oceanobacillus sp. 1P07AA TaxID=3132293 RepID=UPI0039A53134